MYMAQHMCRKSISSKSFAKNNALNALPDAEEVNSRNPLEKRDATFLVVPSSPREMWATMEQFPLSNGFPLAKGHAFLVEKTLQSSISRDLPT
jgi:hypothetical protein